jgi:hypothetical protein
MRILFSGANHDKDNWDSQTYSLAYVANHLGYRICSSIDDDPDVLICVDYHKSSELLLSVAQARGIPKVLIKQEPTVVQPQHGKGTTLKRFELVISRGRPNERPQFNTYQEWDTSRIEHEVRIKRTVAISANKWSMIPGELYSLRRRAYSEIEGVDVFGPGWNRSAAQDLTVIAKEAIIAVSNGYFPSVRNLEWSLKQPKNYLGVAESKSRVLSSYEVSLVIENSEGYMSEKLIDCILSGTIPVYVGERADLFGIPENLTIQAEPTLESIRSSISRALKMDGRQYRIEAKAWVQSPGVKENWEHFSVTKKMLEHIQVFLEAR